MKTGSGPTASGTHLDARWAGAGRAGQNLRFVLNELKPAVKRMAAHHLKGDIGVAVVDSVTTGAPRDDREDDHAKAVHELGTSPEELRLDLAGAR